MRKIKKKFFIKMEKTDEARKEIRQKKEKKKKIIQSIDIFKM